MAWTRNRNDTWNRVIRYACKLVLFDVLRPAFRWITGSTVLSTPLDFCVRVQQVRYRRLQGQCGSGRLVVTCALYQPRIIEAVERQLLG